MIGTSITPKAVTMTAITLALAAILTIVGIAIEGYLWQVPSVNVQDKAAGAEIEKAKAAQIASTAQMLASQAEVEKAKAAQLASEAAIITAKIYGAEVGTRQIEVAATEKITNHQIAEPIDEMGRLEREIIALERKLNSSFSFDEGEKLSAQIKEKQNQIEDIQRAGARSIKNALGMVLQGGAEGLSGLFSAADSGSTIPSSRDMRNMITLEPKQ